MAAPAFTYQTRRSDQAPVAVLPGATVTLREHVRYLLRFEDPLSERDRQRLLDLGGEFLSDDLAILSIDNFVGTTSLAGVGIEVVSAKIGPEGVSRLLEDVSALSSSLVFGWRSPTGFAGVPDPAPSLSGAVSPTSAPPLRDAVPAAGKTPPGLAPRDRALPDTPLRAPPDAHAGRSHGPPRSPRRSVDLRAEWRGWSRWHRPSVLGKSPSGQEADV